LHAESNAITKACKSPISTQNATMYCTHSCCVECAKLIIQSGIVNFIYLNDYRDMQGVELLLKAGVYVIKATDVTETNRTNALEVLSLIK
jgi:dCMP deaminase